MLATITTINSTLDMALTFPLPLTQQATNNQLFF